MVEKYSQHLSEDFEENRKFLEKVMDVEGNTVKNRIAGYVTRLVKNRSRATAA